MELSAILWSVWTVFSLILAASANSVEPATIIKESDVYTNVLPAHCLQKRAIESNYRATGFIWTLDHDLRVYQTRNESWRSGGAAGASTGGPSSDSDPNRGHESHGRDRHLLFAVYDIFGFHPNTKQVVDKLAEESGGQFTVVMPDFFRGGWSMADWPLVPGSMKQKQFQEFMARSGSWEHVASDLRRLMQHYRKLENGGYTRFGIFGFCWGGKMSVQAATYMGGDGVDEIRAAAIIHPANVITADANAVKVPMYLIPSADEPDMVPFYEILESKFGADNVGHTRFKDMRHGFSAARGNFSDPLNRERVDEVIHILHKFFEKQLNGSSRLPGGGVVVWFLTSVVLLVGRSGRVLHVTV